MIFVGNLYFITFTMLFLAMAGKMATFKKNMAIFAQNDLVTLVSLISAHSFLMFLKNFRQNNGKKTLSFH